VEEVKLFDVMGREVYHASYDKKEVMTDFVFVDNMASGNYFIFIRANNANFTSKIFR
jgi:hypothetical protein